MSFILERAQYDDYKTTVQVESQLLKAKQDMASGVSDKEDDDVSIIKAKTPMELSKAATGGGVLEYAIVVNGHSLVGGDII